MASDKKRGRESAPEGAQKRLQTESSSTFTSPISPSSTRNVVLVTGGAGFIGSSVAESLLQRGDIVVVVDELNDYYNPNQKRENIQSLLDQFRERCIFYEADICDNVVMTNVFTTHQPNLVCHLAARAGVRPSIEEPFLYLHSNIEGTLRLLELSKDFNVSNFVYASSSSVYGGSEEELFTESQNVDRPVSPYAATKKACELLAYTYSHLYKINTSGLRFFTVYGPRGRPDMAPFKFIDRIARGLPIDQYGDGSTSRDYTYIDDIVDGVVAALDTPRPYEIYNLGNGNPVLLKCFIETIERLLGKQAKIRVLPEQPGDVPRTCADIIKSKTILNYTPKVSIEEGLERTVNWYLSRCDSR